MLLVDTWIACLSEGMFPRGMELGWVPVGVLDLGVELTGAALLEATVTQPSPSISSCLCLSVSPIRVI